jgi:hypothetical protein
MKKTNKRKKWTWISGLGLLLLLTAGAIWMLRGEANGSSQTAQAGDIVTAFVGDLSASATATGQNRCISTSKPKPK